MRRLYRNLDVATKQKISNKLQGRTMTADHKQKISNSMKNYWATIPTKPTDENNEGNNQGNEEQI